MPGSTVTEFLSYPFCFLNIHYHLSTVAGRKQPVTIHGRMNTVNATEMTEKAKKAEPADGMKP